MNKLRRFRQFSLECFKDKISYLKQISKWIYVIEKKREFFFYPKKINRNRIIPRKIVKEFFSCAFVETAFENEVRFSVFKASILMNKDLRHNVYRFHSLIMVSRSQFRSVSDAFGEFAWRWRCFVLFCVRFEPVVESRTATNADCRLPDKRSKLCCRML